MGELIDWVFLNGGIAVCVYVTPTSQEPTKNARKPSIEFWFLIHYVNRSKYFQNSDAVIRMLRKHISDYNKTGNFLEKQQWVAAMSTDERQTEACNRATLLSPDSESYPEIHNAIKLFTDTK